MKKFLKIWTRLLAKTGLKGAGVGLGAVFGGLLEKVRKPGFFTFLLRFIFYIILIILSIAIGVLLDDDLTCTDSIQEEINILKSDIDYWQGDLEGLRDIYSQYGYDVRDVSQLTPEQLQHKRDLEEQIQDGRNAVSSKIGELKRLREQQNALYNAPITVKRDVSHVDSPEDKNNNKRT